MKTSPPDEASPAGAGRASLRGFACGFLLLVPTLLQAGIASTKHNLTGTEDGPVMNVCVFCHTPAGDPSAAAEPTWTAGTVASGETTFTTFDDLGRLDPNSGNVAGTVSVACLSCHDDAQAFGVSSYEASDHPFGVVYRGATVPGVDIDDLPTDSTDSSGSITYVQGSMNAPARFANSANIANAEFRPTTFGIIDGNPTWWVDTGIEGRQRTDIKLYSRHFGENLAVPYVECASCHDPHTETPTFLRIENRGSALCLGCHDI